MPCRRVVPDYTADLSLPMSDRGRNVKAPRLCTCGDLIIYIVYISNYITTDNLQGISKEGK